jgi:hypothetical protein
MSKTELSASLMTIVFSISIVFINVYQVYSPTMLPADIFNPIVIGSVVVLAMAIYGVYSIMRSDERTKEVKEIKKIILSDKELCIKKTDIKHVQPAVQPIRPEEVLKKVIVKKEPVEVVKNAVIEGNKLKVIVEDEPCYKSRFR